MAESEIVRNLWRDRFIALALWERPSFPPVWDRARPNLPRRISWAELPTVIARSLAVRKVTNRDTPVLRGVSAVWTVLSRLAELERIRWRR